MHFVTHVLVPSSVVGEGNIKKYIGDVLAPFDEGIEVKEYEAPCSCVGFEANMAGINAGWAAVKEKWESLGGDQQQGVDWGKFVDISGDIYESARAATLSTHPMFGLPNPSCSECGGTGVIRTTYNPISKWDWWEIGGRYANWWDTNSNAVLAKDILDLGDEYIPLAVIDLDGRWHSSNSVETFETSKRLDDKTNWAKEARAVYASSPDSTVVVCDLHI